MIPAWLAAIFAVLGGLVIVVGVALIYLPGGVIVAGIGLLAAGLLTDTEEPQQ